MANSKELMWLNLYGRESVRHRLKNNLKTQKRHFLPVIELMLDSLTTIKVEPHQCPMHQPIHEIFTKILRIGDFEELIFFQSGILNFFFKKLFF